MTKRTKPTQPTQSFRDRVRELRRVRAGDLVPNESNWRTHPQAQQDALRGVLAEIGLADACLARELPDGRLSLIDGHLRRDLDPEQILPVLVLDVDESEAKKVLATLDPLAAMAEANSAALNSLISEIDANDAEFAHLLASIADSTHENASPNETPASAISPADMELQPHEHYDYIVVLARNTQEWNVLCERLGIVPKMIHGSRKKTRIGICRAIAASQLLERLSRCPTES